MLYDNNSWYADVDNGASRLTTTHLSGRDSGN